MMMMTNYGDNQDVAVERSLYMMKKNINLSQVARFVWSIPDNDDDNDNNNYYGDGINWQWAWNRSELYLQLEQIQIPVSSVLVSLNVHCLVTTFPTCWQRSPRGQSARPGYIQHYMLSTLYVERRVPGDGQRDYMLTLLVNTICWHYFYKK